MSKSLSFRLNVSSIMEMMTKTAIEEICKIVESDFTLLRQELSFVMSENRVLKDKMRCVENKAESTRIRKKETASISYQSTCVQTEAGVQPSINGIFGKEWCTSLWDQKIHSPEDGLPDAVNLYPESQYKHKEPNGSTQPLIKEENRSEEDTDPNYEVSQASEGFLISSVCEPSADSKKYNHPFDSDEIPRKAFHSSDEHSTKNTVIDNTVEQLMAPIEDPLIFDDPRLLNTFSVEQNVPCPSETQKDETLQELCADTETTPENDESRFNLHNLQGQKEETVKPKLRCYEGKMILSPNATKHKVTKHKQQPPVKISKSHRIRYHCEICGKGFIFKTHLAVHSVVHTRERPHKCSFCGKGFSHKGALQIHECAHTGERPFTCDTCGKGFGKKFNLQNHERIHTGERPFTCDTCGRSFNQKICLQNHERTHTGERPFTCDTCGRGFNQKISLQNHERTHTGERPFICDTCGRGFNQKISLQNHERTHTGERPFTCDTCGRSFNQKISLQNHERTHTGERPFICDTCGRGFGKKFSLQNHERIHTGERPFTCDTCGKTFTQKITLDKHLLVHNEATKKKQRKSKKYK